jgi:signal transduction histidine kinase
MANLANPQICGWEPTQYFFFSNNVWGDFIYYSHLFPAIAVLIAGVFVLANNPKHKAAQALMLFAIVFTSWSLIDLVLWASDRSDVIMFFWSILIYFDLLVYVTAFYFVYTYLRGHWPGWKSELAIAVSFIPLFLFAHTSLNLIAFDFTNCWREALEGPLWQQYVQNVELLFVVWILVLGAVHLRQTTDKRHRLEITLLISGVFLMLASFSLGNIIGSFGIDWELGQYGLFGVPVFVVFLTYLLVRYQAFEQRLLTAEALTAGLVVMVGSLLLVQRIENVQVIATVTLALVTVLGFTLIRSVRQEEIQHQKIEKLAVQLKRANKRLKELDQMKSEFVSIASHQLRSPLTAVRGYASMLLEGTYGKLPKKAEKTIQKIADSSRFMALSVEDYLNVSRIESGNMKYECDDFNLKDVSEQITDELRPEGIKRGLALMFRSDVDSIGIVHADLGKTRQIILNLIDNAMKYTPKGSIMVFVHDDVKHKTIQVDVIDSGIGMSEETIENIFDKFERAHNANEVNVTGTGLGLYVARTMAEAMDGSVTAISDGEGKGSTFTLTLPLAL